MQVQKSPYKVFLFGVNIFFFFYRDFWSKFFLLTGPLYYILADRTISLITTFQSLSNFEKINILIFGGIFCYGDQSWRIFIINDGSLFIKKLIISVTIHLFF
jgi:hypothetical protein